MKSLSPKSIFSLSFVVFLLLVTAVFIHIYINPTKNHSKRYRIFSELYYLYTHDETKKQAYFAVKDYLGFNITNQEIDYVFSPETQIEFNFLKFRKSAGNFIKFNPDVNAEFQYVSVVPKVVVFFAYFTYLFGALGIWFYFFNIQFWLKELSRKSFFLCAVYDAAIFGSMLWFGILSLSQIGSIKVLVGKPEKKQKGVTKNGKSKKTS